MERTAAIRLDARSLEDELALRLRQQTSLADLGLRALAGIATGSLFDEAVSAAAGSLEAEFVALLEQRPDESVHVRAAAGWSGEQIEGSIGAAGFRLILEASEPVLVDDVRAGTQFEDAAPAGGRDVRSIAAVAVAGGGRPFGALVACATRPFAFSPEDAVFLQSVANVLGEAIRRHQTEADTRDAIRQQRDAVTHLRSLDEMKNTFLEAVSHELRTPLASVLGFALTLEARHEQMAAEEIDVALERLAVNARKLDRLLRDLLDLDRLYRRIIVPRRRRTDLAAVVRAAVAECDLGTRTVHCDLHRVMLDVDAAKIDRIVENLLINVAKHTPADASIWVRVDERPDGALLTVEDDGPGVPDALKGAIFDVFQRGASAHAHAPGTGIGLALVMRFAELHGGRAWVEDRPGGGARFRVYLPGGDAVPLPGQV